MTEASISLDRAEPIDRTPRLELRNISKSFGGVHALKNVDFAAYAG